MLCDAMLACILTFDSTREKEQSVLTKEEGKESVKRFLREKRSRFQGDWLDREKRVREIDTMKEERESERERDSAGKRLVW